MVIESTEGNNKSTLLVERERERERVREIGTVYGCYNDELEKYVSNCKRVFKDMKYIGKVNVPIL